MHGAHRSLANLCPSSRSLRPDVEAGLVNVDHTGTAVGYLEKPSGVAVPFFFDILAIPIGGGRFQLLQCEEQAMTHATKWDSLM